MKKLSILLFCIMSYLSYSQDGGGAFELGYESRNEMFITGGGMYSWTSGDWDLQTVFGSYGYGLSGDYQMVKFGYTYALLFIMPSISGNYTWDQNGNGNFALEPQIGVGAHGLYSLHVGYNINLNNDIPNYDNRFNLTFKVGTGWLFWDDEDTSVFRNRR